MRPLRVWLGLGLALAVTVGVSGPTRATAPRGRYTASGGTVVDGATHLTWQQTAPATGGDDGAGRSTWVNAKGYCARLGEGYRLPTAKELLTIVDFSEASPAIDTSADAFPGTPSEPFWTATPLAGTTPASAWFISFDDGYAGNVDVAQPNRVRCVR